MQEEETRALARRSDRVAKAAKLGRAVNLSKVAQGPPYGLIGGRPFLFEGRIPSEGAPGLGDVGQSFGPGGGKGQVEPDHREIGDQELEAFPEGGTWLGQEVQLGRAERSDRLDGEDVVTWCKDREQVDRLLGESGQAALLGFPAGEHRRYCELRHVGGRRRVRIPGGAVGETRQVGQALPIDRSLGIENRNQRPLIEDDQHDRCTGAGIAEIDAVLLAGVSRALSHPAVQYEQRRHEDGGRAEHQSEGTDAAKANVGPRDGDAGGQGNGHRCRRGQTAYGLQCNHSAEHTGRRRDCGSRPGWQQEPKRGGRCRKHQRWDDGEYHHEGEQIAHVEVADCEELGRLPQEVVHRLREGEAAEPGNGEDAGDESSTRLASVGAGCRVRG